MSFSIIVAIAKNRAIGRNNDLLWYISEDLKRFKRITTGHTVIMGRNTFKSLPKGPLPKRKNIVITDNPEDCTLPEMYPDRDCMMVDSIKKAMDACNPKDENFVIGGESIYKQFLPYADRLYLTLIHENVTDADVFFPDFAPEKWTEIEREDHLDEKPAYSYLILEKA
ncbi:MAG: dihydrofolate reductase [Bacteroidetes bacterium]|jgi:dihydrofolate reductase|nr:dihydrofolate reductase [Bacteroidota bacterium]